MTRTLLAEILECNGSYLKGSPKILDSSGEPFLIVACMDNRLTGLLEPALGLPRNRAHVLRTAGNTISPSNRDVIRSIAAGLYLKKVKEIFIIGHSDCGMARFQAGEAIDSFRAAGIPRSAFGEEDLRIWFGAFSDVKSNVLQSIDYLRRCGIVSTNVKIHGLILDSLSGSLEIVLNGDTHAAPSTPVAEGSRVDTLGPTPARVSESGDSPKSRSIAQDPHGIRQRPVVIGDGRGPGGRVEAAHGPTSYVELMRVLREIVTEEKKNPHFKRDLSRIATELKSERDPVRFVKALRELARNYETRYPQLPEIVEQLVVALEGKGPAGARIVELLRILLD
jgi:carbonic anhydrase